MKRKSLQKDFDGAGMEISMLRRGLMLVLALLFVALTVHEIFGDNGWLALRRQRRQLQAKQRQIQELKRENKQLQKDIQGLQSDPHTIERYAREQMHFARPGEIIYTFPRQNLANPNSSAPPKAPGPVTGVNR
jgi:cell division protein FtsB